MSGLNGEADTARLRIRVIVLGGSLFSGFRGGIAFGMAITSAALGGGRRRRAALEVGELLDPCRERPSTACTFLTIYHRSSTS